jgi:hypothetical protein
VRSEVAVRLCSKKCNDFMRGCVSSGQDEYQSHLIVQNASYDSSYSSTRELYILGWIESLQAMTHPVLIVFTRVPAESNVSGAD